MKQLIDENKMALTNASFYVVGRLRIVGQQRMSLSSSGEVVDQIWNVILKNSRETEFKGVTKRQLFRNQGLIFKVVL